MARQNAQVHVLRMLPGILVLGCLHNLVPRGDDPFGKLAVHSLVEVGTNTTNYANPDAL